MVVTSMVGKKATLKALRLLLHQLSMPCLRTTAQTRLPQIVRLDCTRHALRSRAETLHPRAQTLKMKSAPQT